MAGNSRGIALLLGEDTSTLTVPCLARMFRKDRKVTNVASVEKLTGLDGQATAAVKLSTLRQLAFVPTVVAQDEDSPAEDKHGYQREQSKRRFPAIGKYFLSGGAITPLLVSVRVDEDDRDGFVRMLKVGDVEGIHNEYSPRVFSIIDGQHRLGGLMWAQDEDPSFDPAVPVMLFFGLSYEAEATLFDTVNTKQKNIPKPLVEFTKATITEVGGDSYDQKIRGIALRLTMDEDSPFYGRVNMTGSISSGRKTTFEGLRRSMTEMYPREFLARVEADHNPVELAKLYWNKVAEVCSTAWNGLPSVNPESGEAEATSYRLTDLVGIATVSKLGKDVLTSALERAALEQDSEVVETTIEEMASRFADVDWRKGGETDAVWGRAGWAGVKVLYENLYPIVTSVRTASRRGRARAA